MARKNYIGFTQDQLPFTDPFNDDLLVREYYWSGNQAPAPTITSGELYFDIASPDTNNYNSRVYYGAKVYGNFDIQFDIRFVPVSNNATYDRNLSSYFEFFNSVGIKQGRADLYRRESNVITPAFQGQVFNASFGTIFSNSVVPTSNVNDNTLRITYNKATDTMAFYYLDGTWVEITSGTTGLSFDYIIPTLLGSAVNSSFDGYFDNFQINSADKVEWSYPFRDNFESPIETQTVTLPYTETFTGSGVVRDTIFTTASNTSVYISSNQLNIAMVSGSGGNVTTINGWYLTGDFTIDVDYNMTGAPATTGYSFGISVNDGKGGAGFTQWKGYNANYIFQSTSGYDITASYPTGKLRITRVGNVYRGWYWNGSGWINTGTTAGAQSSTGTTEPVYITIFGSGFGGTPTYTATFDNFIIQSAGSVVSGLYNEPPVESWWRNTSQSLIDYDQLKFETSAIGNAPYTDSLFRLRGDFDIQVDFDTDAQARTGYLIGGLRVWIAGDSNNYMSMYYDYNEGAATQETFRVYGVVGGSSVTDSPIGESGITSGKLRLVRTGSSIVCYYDKGSGWVTAATKSAFYDDVQVRLQSARYITGAFSPTIPSGHGFSNFIVNSADAITWEGGSFRRFKALTTETFYTEEFNRENDTLWNNYANSTVSGGRYKWNPTDNVNSNLYNQFAATLVGDFDIQFDFNEIENIYAGITGGSNSVGYLIDVSGSGVITLSQYAHNTSGGRRYYLWSDQGGLNQQYTTSDTSGKLRIRRVSGTITVFVWSGTQWEWNGNTSGYQAKTGWTGNTTATLNFFQGTNGTYECDVDNWYVSADSITWNGGGEWVSTTMNRFVPFSSETTLIERFDGVDGSVPNSTLWTPAANILVQNNKLNHYDATPTVSTIWANSSFYLNGEFDIQVYVEWGAGFTKPTVNFAMAQLMVTDVGGANQRYMYIANSTVDERWGAYDGTTWHIVTDPDSVAGLLRIVRDSSNNIYGYYWSGTQWEWNGNTSGQLLRSSDSAAKRVRLSYAKQNSGVYEANFDNFTINSADSITWNGGGDWLDYAVNKFSAYTSETTLLDSFTGVDGSAPNPTLWNAGVYTIQSNRIQSTLSTNYENISSIFRVNGDFVYEIDYEILVDTGDGLQDASLQCYIDGNNYYNIGRQNNAGTTNYYSNAYEGGVWSGTSTVATSDNSGRLRIERSGTDITVSFWNGSAWQSPSGGAYTGAPTGQVTVIFYKYIPTASASQVEFDNFQVVSADSITWNGGGQWSYIGNV